MTGRPITVAGSFGERQKVLGQLYRLQRHKIQLVARLEREPGNEHDPNAIAVSLGPVTGTLRPVGYIPRELAAELAPQMDAGEPVEITRVRITRNWFQKSYPMHELKLTLAVRESQRRYTEVNEVGF